MKKDVCDVELSLLHHESVQDIIGSSLLLFWAKGP